MKFLLPILSKRFFILFALLILSVFQIPSSASAATITVSTTSDAVIGDCTTICTFRDAIASSTAGDIIVFDPALTAGGPATIILASNYITIDHDLTITGPGSSLLTINGDNKYEMLYIGDGDIDVSISGLTFANGKLGYYAASIENIGMGSLNIYDSIFTNNNCNGNGSGGAVYSSSNAQNLTITNSTFIDNKCNNGADIYAESVNLVVSSSTFSGENSTGGYSGGSIFSKVTSGASITNSTFTNYSVDDEGGAIYVDSGNLTITDSTFTGNSATSSGGAIYHNSSGDLEISGSTFTGNSANYGGVFRSMANNLLITDSVFTDNTAVSGGAGIYLSGLTLEISSSTFSGNITEGGDYGSAVSAFVDNVSIIDSTFTNNTMGNNSIGGAVFGYGDDEFIVSSSTFTGNTADLNGGAIYLENYATSTITDSTFTSNSATTSGGAIYTNLTVANLTVNSSTFDGNIAGGDGGAIEFLGGAGKTLDITNSTFVGNSSINGDYGIIFAPQDSDVILNNSTFYDNSSYAGILSFYGTSLVTNSIFASSSPRICDTWADGITSGGHNIIDDSSCDSIFTAEGDITSTDPLLDIVNGLADNGGPVKTIALLPNSPAINAGNDESAPLTDARGYARVGISDIGAYEYQPPVVIVPSVTPSTPSRVLGSRRRIVLTTQPAVTPSISTSTSSTPLLNTQIKDLKIGSKGSEVKNLQIILNTLGYKISETGPGSKGNETDMFGNLTKQALIKFQKENNITPPEGYFGPKTRGVIIIKLISLLKSYN